MACRWLANTAVNISAEKKVTFAPASLNHLRPRTLRHKDLQKRSALCESLHLQATWPSMNHNHTSYQARLNFVQNLLCYQLGFGPGFPLLLFLIDQLLTGTGMQPDSRRPRLTPVQYDPECPFKYNNFVYRVALHSPISSNHVADDTPLQPGCIPIPEGTKELIVRFTNHDTEGNEHGQPCRERGGHHKEPVAHSRLKQIKHIKEIHLPLQYLNSNN
ncbi:hypothetical protein VTK56DRAFT_2507 [Thermocarpiscus australiensis]